MTKLMKHILLSLFIFVFILNLYSDGISGIIINSKTKTRLSYVRVGLENNTSALSDSLGNFHLILKDNQEYKDRNVKLIFDRPGFLPLSLSIGDFEKSGKIVSMTPTPHEKSKQNTANMYNVSSKTHKDGATRGSSTYVFMLDFMKELGGEFGIVIGNKIPCLISSLNLYIGHSKIRHLKFRVNVYDVNNNFKRINDHEIIAHADLGNAYQAVHDWVNFNISDYNLTIDREVLIVFENIYHQNIGEDIEMSVAGILASVGNSNSYFRIHPFNDFAKIGIRISMYAETNFLN